MNQSKKEKYLEILREFCQRPMVVGLCSNLWYGGLSNYYPCHFLIYTQNSKGKEWRKEESKKKIRERINERVNTILSMQLDKNDGELYEQLISKLDKMIEERENKLKV
jgi:hypothetical protein